MEVSMSITRRGKYTDSNICTNVQVRDCCAPTFLAICKLADFSYPVRGKSLSFYRGKIRINPVSTKFRHVIRSDFQQTYNLKVSSKYKLYVSCGASLCFRGIEAVFLLYKSAHYKVITYLQETCSVFSIQFFSLLLPLSV